MKRFFVRSAQGIWFYDTAEEAKAEADRLLEAERYYATREGEWGDDAFCIIWGEVRGRVNERWADATEDEPEYVELTLVDVKQ